MNLKMYATCFAIALLGMIFSMLIKGGILQRKARISNAPFSFAKFITNDWLSWGASFVFIIICLFLIDNLLAWKPIVTNYVKGVFVFIGYFGGDLGSKLFSETDKRLNNIIDVKTNIADGIKDKSESVG